MKKPEDNRDFSMSYPALMQLGDKAVSLINRDAAELAIYGIDGTVLFFIVTKTQELKDFPTDIEFLGAVTDATEIKDALADQVKVAVRSIMVRAKNGFGEGVGKYSRFGTLGMNTFSDIELLQCGKRVVRMATLFLPLLAPKGLTQLMIDDLTAITVLFDNAIDAQDDAVRLRDSNTADRAELGNLLYNKIVEVFEDGKDYWFTRNEAKYNDYVLYTAGGSSPATTFILMSMNLAAAQMITYDFIAITPAGGNLHFEFDDGATEDVFIAGMGVYTSVSHFFSTAGNHTAKVSGDLMSVGESRSNSNKMVAWAFPDAMWPRNITGEDNQLVTFLLNATFTGVMILKLKGNMLNVVSVNAILVQLDNNGLSGGTVDLSGGTNAAPTGAGIAAKNHLIARGWTVITN